MAEPEKDPEPEAGGRSCACCATHETPMWRVGPDGPNSLCNKCGLMLSKGKIEQLPGGGYAEVPRTGVVPAQHGGLAAQRARRARRGSGGEASAETGSGEEPTAEGGWDGESSVDARFQKVIPEQPVLTDEFRALLLSKGFVRCPGEGCGVELSGESLPRHLTRSNRCRSGGLAAMSPERAAETRMLMVISRSYRRAIVQNKAMPPDVQLASMTWKERDAAVDAAEDADADARMAAGALWKTGGGDDETAGATERPQEVLAAGGEASKPRKRDVKVVCPAPGCGQTEMTKLMYYHLKHACEFGHNCTPEVMQAAFSQSEAATRRILLPPRKQHSLAFTAADTEHLPAPNPTQARTRHKLQLGPYGVTGNAPSASSSGMELSRASVLSVGQGTGSTGGRVSTRMRYGGGQIASGASEHHSPSGRPLAPQHQQRYHGSVQPTNLMGDAPGRDASGRSTMVVGGGGYVGNVGMRTPQVFSPQGGAEMSPDFGSRGLSSRAGSASTPTTFGNDFSDGDGGGDNAEGADSLGSDCSEQQAYDPAPKAPHPMLTALRPLPIMASLPESLRRASTGLGPAGAPQVNSPLSMHSAAPKTAFRQSPVPRGDWRSPPPQQQPTQQQQYSQPLPPPPPPPPPPHAPRSAPGNGRSDAAGHFSTPPAVLMNHKPNDRFRQERGASGSRPHDPYFDYLQAMARAAAANSAAKAAAAVAGGRFVPGNTSRFVGSAPMAGGTGMTARLSPGQAAPPAPQQRLTRVYPQFPDIGIYGHEMAYSNNMPYPSGGRGMPSNNMPYPSGGRGMSSASRGRGLPYGSGGGSGGGGMPSTGRGGWMPSASRGRGMTIAKPGGALPYANGGRGLSSAGGGNGIPTANGGRESVPSGTRGNGGVSQIGVGSGRAERGRGRGRGRGRLDGGGSGGGQNSGIGGSSGGFSTNPGNSTSPFRPVCETESVAVGHLAASSDEELEAVGGEDGSRGPRVSDKSAQLAGQIAHPRLRTLFRNHALCPAVNCGRTLLQRQLISHIESSRNKDCLKDIMRHAGLYEACKAIDLSAAVRFSEMSARVAQRDEAAEAARNGLAQAELSNLEDESSELVVENPANSEAQAVRDDAEATEDEDEEGLDSESELDEEPDDASIGHGSSGSEALCEEFGSSSSESGTDADEISDAQPSRGRKREFKAMAHSASKDTPGEDEESEDTHAHKRIRTNPSLKPDSDDGDVDGGDDGESDLERYLGNEDDLEVEEDEDDNEKSDDGEKWECPVPGCEAMISWSRIPVHIHDPDECKPRDGLCEADVNHVEAVVSNAYEKRWGGE